MLIIYIFKLLTILVFGPIYFIVAIFTYIFDEEASKEIFLKYLHLTFKLLEVTIQCEFDEPETQHTSKSILVLLNQSSFLDTLAVCFIPVKRVKGIINIEMALYPVSGWFFSLISFTIIRQWSSQAKRVLNNANKFLRAGGNIFISIEGKRSRDGKINEYKKGPIVMAINNQSNIVPIIIYGARECLPFGSFWVKAGTIKIRFLKPLSTQGYSYEDRNRLREQLVSVAKKEGLTFKSSH